MDRRRLGGDVKLASVEEPDPEDLEELWEDTSSDELEAEE